MGSQAPGLCSLMWLASRAFPAAKSTPPSIIRSAEARLHLPPDQFQQRPESQTMRSLYDCPQIPVGPAGVLCRVVVATR